jgi:hypothetical protein
MGLLVKLDELETLLKVPPGTLNGDAYTELMMRAASDKVRSVANQPRWELEITSLDDVLAPTRAGFIALWLAKRAWEDKGNLIRRTAGPISSTFSEDGVRGLQLEDDEREWLEGHGPDGGSGVWIMKHHGTGVSRRPFAETPDGYSFSDGDLDFAHGMTMSGPPKGADHW